MPKKQLTVGMLLLACGLAGCVAAPLVQIAAGQALSAATPCPADAVCQPTGMVDGLSKGLGESFHKLTSLASDSTTPPR